MEDRIEQFLARWKRENSPGLTLAVVRRGKITLQRNFGLANLDYGVPINTNTVFRVASLAKQFTAACIGILESEGALSLNDDIRRWIPQLPQYQTPITLEQLLWHTSGLHDFPHLLWGLSGRSFGDAVTQEGVLDILSQIDQTNFPPGTKHQYCNSGYFLLGLVVARITGSLGKFAQEHIFSPLGMRDTHFQDSYTRVIPNRAIGYTPKGSGYVISDSPTTTLVGDDGLFTTLEDMLIWERNFYSDKLGGSLTERMRQKGRLKDGSPVDYGHGLFLHERKGLDLFWHYGEYLGFQSVIRSFPEQQLSIICLANTTELAPIDFARELEDLLLEDYFQPSPEAQSYRAIPLAEPLVLSKYAGLYCNRQEGFTIEARIKESGLEMVINNKQGFDLTMVAKDRAEAAGLDFPLGLEFSSDGRAKNFFDEDLVFPLEPLAERPQAPTSRDLAQLAGEYYSASLGTSWIVAVDGGSLRLINKDRHRLSPEEPLVHVFEDFYSACFNLWRRKIHFQRDGEMAMVVLNGDSAPISFLKVQ